MNDFTVIKGGTRASECIECSEKLLFLYEIFQIDSNNQTCQITKKKGEKNKHSTKKAGAALVRTITSKIPRK